MKKLSTNEQIELKEMLSYLHVSELESLLEQLNLSSKGFNKNELVTRLLHDAITGQELPPVEIPTISKAPRGTISILNPNTRMLYGSYKNDLETRNFFKKLVGSHFHFTAQGIDWLRERWIAGNPPTYAEFAAEWQAEYERNKKDKRAPKQEWAYIRFTQEFLKQFPHASKIEITAAWKVKREEFVEKVRAFFFEQNSSPN